ncbi:hypothetical protein [Holdemania filiformis]|uniref:Uncharacterized protein n=1 Tax=Holdemania filiformis DSM 12042 TaxID=545696 RepID=B9Y850_9FIRM|nr:hypothetical protein [Holdemania filiformis]EEF67844.1 hypothetical protein HOLDEFILI_01996 [Holdemania filiformis DSM 12042]MCQ4953387.1 hypothetical protein [Holdemania filiformis]
MYREEVENQQRALIFNFYFSLINGEEPERPVACRFVLSAISPAMKVGVL